ncbi:hypothetical protein BV20DRAFT_328526 [Pilatotrama ljubarskyi]|nr:hypothetical protein BV20DRAFT_328526 [Pilatotrama ljubarskyi]
MGPPPVSKAFLVHSLCCSQELGTLASSVAVDPELTARQPQAVTERRLDPDTSLRDCISATVESCSLERLSDLSGLPRVFSEASRQVGSVDEKRAPEPTYPSELCATRCTLASSLRLGTWCSGSESSVSFL